MKRIYYLLSIKLSLLLITGMQVNAQQLNGNYTIDPALSASMTNFQTMTAAVDTLIMHGVSGPVIFNIASGTYTEQIVIPAISGASALNTITFQSSANHADSVILTYTGAANNTVVKLNNTTFVNFKYMTVLTTGPASNWGFQLTGTASYDSIVYCKISVIGDYGIYAFISGKRNVFSYNTIIGGSYGIYLGGTNNTTAITDSNTIVGNNVQNSVYYGLYFNYTSNTFVSNNSITNNGEGIVEKYGSHQHFYYNSINVSGFGMDVTYDDMRWSGNEWKNNIIASSSTSNAVIINSNVPGTNNIWDYNLYFTSGVNLFYNSASAYSTWRAGGQDVHSIVANPGFTSATDLHLVSGCNKGTPLSNILTDIDGITRNIPPVIGAYESNGLGDNIALLALVTPEIPLDTNLNEIKVRVQNVGANTLTSVDYAYTLNGSIPALITWSGILIPCGIDTITFTSVNFTGLNNIQIYAGLPSDVNRNNDTIKVTLYQPLNGVYTIGGSIGPRNYENFTTAVADLNKAGISGPVLFNIAAGTNYTESPVLLNQVVGSDLYNITFQKSGVGANPAIYGINGTGTGDAVITIKGSKNIIFDGINIVDSISNSNDTKRMEYGYALINGAFAGSSNNTIKNCKISLNRMNTVSYGIYQSASNLIGPEAGNHNNRYENIKVENSYNGIFLLGYALFPDTNNVITSSGNDTTIIGSLTANDIGNGTAAVAGIQLLSQKNVEVSGCIIRNLTHTGTATIHGIYLNNITTNIDFGKAIIRNNRIYNITRTSTSATGTAHGIRIDIAPSATATVFNNVIYGLKTGALTSASVNMILRGITHCLSGNGAAGYYHNSVNITQSTSLNGSSAAFWKGGSGYPTIIRNNMFINTTGGQTGNSKHYAVVFNTLNIVPSSNNLLWASGINGFVGRLSATDYQTLLSFKLATQQDTGSIYYLPDVITNGFLRPNTADTACWALNGRGVHLDSSITNTDIDGNIRPSSRFDGVPDIGAYEFTPASTPPLAIAVPAIPAAGSTQVFLFGGDTVAKITWNMGFGTPPNISVWQYAGEKPPYIGPSQNYMYNSIRVNMPGSSSLYYHTLELKYRASWLGTNQLEQDVRIIRKPDNDIWSFPSGANIIDTNSKYLVAENLFDTAVWYTGTDPSNPLPVTLLQFTGNKNGKDVVLNWITASEKNVNRFEIDRSTDGFKFEKVDVVKAKGNNSVSNPYQYIDTKPSVQNGLLYYRLRSIDNDDRFTYSDRIIVRWNDDEKESTIVFPNPFASEAYVAFTLGGSAQVKAVIMDITGKIQSEDVTELDKGYQVISLNTKDLNPGIYFVTIIQNGTANTYKIIKQ